MRFPYSVVGMLFAFPADADANITKLRTRSTFRTASRLFATISGRSDYTGAGEKFEHVAMLLFTAEVDDREPIVRLFDAQTEQEISEAEYYERLRDIYNRRNPHDPVGEEAMEEVAEDADPADTREERERSNRRL